MPAAVSDFSVLLGAVRNGDGAAVNRVLPLVYEELRRLARHHLAGQRPGHTLQTADLVNEAYVRLVRVKELNLTDRVHFFALASTAMRSVLVDHARRRAYAKRGGNAVRVSLTELSGTSEQKSAEILAVDDALRRLAVLDARKAQIVELRYFAGMSIDETAHVLGLSSRTIKREWHWAKAWLFRELQETTPR